MVIQVKNTVDLFFLLTKLFFHEIDTQALREHFNMCGITLESNIRPEDLSFTEAKK